MQRCNKTPTKNLGPTRWPARSTRRSFGPARRPARPPRWPTRSAGRAFGPTRGPTRPTRRSTGPPGRAFGSTRWSFRAPTVWSFVVGRLCRLLSGYSRALLRPTIWTEIGSLIGELSTTIRTEGVYFYFIGELHTAI